MSGIQQTLIGSYGSVNTLLTGLVGAYKLDNVNDSSGNSRTLVNTGSTTFGTGLVGNCATFGASNTTKKLNYVGATGISDDFAFSTWFRTTTTGVINSPTQIVYGTNRQIDFIYDGANTRVAIWSGAFATSLTPTQAISANTWYHMLISCSSSTIEVFFNNTSLGTLANTATTGKTDGFYLGGQNSWFDQGDRDSTYLWSRALTSTERSTLYNGGAGYEF